MSKNNEKGFTNGFGKFAWVALFITIHTILGILIWVRFYFGNDPDIKERLIFVELAIGSLIWIISSTWLAISKSQKWPVFKAMRRSKNPNNKSPKNPNFKNDEKDDE